MKKNLCLIFVILLGIQFLYARQIRFVFMSDLHYGLERTFRGDSVTAEVVNQAMAEAIEKLSVDFIICGGDIANRMEQGIQSAALSWQQFERTWYAPGIPPIYLLAGNHDISNAIGYTQPLFPERDATCAVEIYNRAVGPDTLRTVETFDYTTDKVEYSFVVKGIRFAVAGMWLDSHARDWLAKELEGDTLPCLLFTHMEPETEAKRFTNPYGDHSINATDGFQNLLVDTCSVGRDELPEREYQQLAQYLQGQTTLKAWFHGHTNYTEFYNFHSLPIFRVDSPIKGELSGYDDTLLSFLVVNIDTVLRQMTVSKYFWNRMTDVWGETKTIEL